MSINQDQPERRGDVAHYRLAAMSEFLAFKLGAEEYCIDILRVQEIRSYIVPTRLVDAPDFIKGIVNLRGVIVPIVDMRLKFDLPLVTYGSLTVVIVLNLGAQVVGMVVDGVSDVVSFAPDELLPTPALTAKIDNTHVLAIGSIRDRMLIVLDVEELMTTQLSGTPTSYPTAVASFGKTR
ncbi:MAG: chemotaxis protein CheW [Sphingomonadaceae bacterium]